MNKKRVALANTTYPALVFRQRAKPAPRLVVFCAAVKEVDAWAEIEPLGPKTQGPQRERKDARVEAIAAFLEANQLNTIPSALIVAFAKGGVIIKKGAGVSEDELPRTITIKKGAATIVDGQHRLLGIKAHKPGTLVPLVGILEADEVEKAFQFLVINNKASRVPATHTKALLAKMKNTALLPRLKGAKLAFDAEGIKDVDLLNSDPESPFRGLIDWTLTPKKGRIVQATAIEASLDYLGGIGIPEYDDRDVRRAVFTTIWRAVKAHWKTLFKQNSRLISKVGIICLTRHIADRITTWADSDELDIDVSDLAQIEAKTTNIIGYMDRKFWTAAWAEKASGGFDTKQGRDRVLAAITQLYRNGRSGVAWYSNIDIIEPSSIE